MARPKKTDPNKNVARLNIRCTKTEHAVLKGKASQAGMSLSNYIRDMSLNGGVIIQESSYDFQTVDQLRRIGINLNQMTKVANATGEIAPAALQTVCGKLDKIFDNILETL